MKSIEIERIGLTKDVLGEGLLWDWEKSELYWVDSISCIIHRLNLATNEREEFKTSSQIGAMALRQSGGAVLGLRDGIYLYDFDTQRETPVAPMHVKDPELRYNDGKVDRQGRFVTGTVQAPRPPDKEFKGWLCTLGSDLRLQFLEDKIGVCNGPCFSPDGQTFYVADSARRTIYAYDYETATGAISNKRPFVDIAPFNANPDGATVDSHGYLWSALITAGKIGRFAPDGRLDRIIDMPVRCPTNVAFGGPNLDILFVTSLWKAASFVSEEEQAGALFAIRGLGIEGLPEARFLG